MKDEAYVNCLAIYYSVLHSHFHIDGHSYPNHIVFRDFSKPSTSLDSNNIDNNFMKEKSVQPYGGQIHDFNGELIKNIFSQNLVKTDFSESLLMAIENFNKEISNPGLVDASGGCIAPKKE